MSIPAQGLGARSLFRFLVGSPVFPLLSKEAPLSLGPSLSLFYTLYDLVVVVPSFSLGLVSAVLDLQPSILSIHIPQRECRLPIDAVFGAIRLALESWPGPGNSSLFRSDYRFTISTLPITECFSIRRKYSSRPRWCTGMHMFGSTALMNWSGGATITSPCPRTLRVRSGPL